MTETKLTKPKFTSPEVPKFSVKAFGEIDITKKMEPEYIDKLVAGVGIRHFKHFYDNLATSMEDYSTTIEENIVTPLSLTIDAIGTKTGEIDAQIKYIQDNMPEIAG